ncbi:hypothetical protein K3495_g443 [Podosphaera aphanis]|nr:hypothetical protein K3495_g443 [Podosphaera aphanis]
MCSKSASNSSAKYGDCIRRDLESNSESLKYYPIVVVGAGESGIAMGCRLKEKLGTDQFRIFDRQTGVGGTWWINRYPGVACDVPAPFYSYSFYQNYKWTSLYPSGNEILSYLQDVCEHFKIVDKIQLNTDVTECRWLDSEMAWELTIRHLVSGAGDLSEYDRTLKIKELGEESVYTSEEKIRAKILVSAIGGLVEPQNLPDDVTGRENFSGDIFHSARWRYDVDLKDKEVIVLGTGCSATQFVPLLSKNYGARSVTQIMRSPPWVIPREAASLEAGKWQKWSPWLSSHVPLYGKLLRYAIAIGCEYDWRLFGSSKYSVNERKKIEAKLLAHMKKKVPKKYYEILTPNYALGCKRRIFDTNWLSSLKNRAVTLTTLPLTSIGEKDVTLGPGRMYPDPSVVSSKAPNHQVTIPADVIILANGFYRATWFHPMEVIGRNGKRLHDIFDERGGPQMYMGTAIDGFPNFFTLYGPNTANGHSSIILASENLINLSLNFIKPILQNDAKVVEVKEQAELKWARDIQGASKKTVWNTGGCRSSYQTEDGWNSTVYPYSQIWFTLYCMFPTWNDWQIIYTKKGKAKNFVSKTLRAVALVAVIYGITRSRLRQEPTSFIMKSVKLMIHSGLKRIGVCG